MEVRGTSQELKELEELPTLWVWELKPIVWQVDKQHIWL